MSIVDWIFSLAVAAAAIACHFWLSFPYCWFSMVLLVALTVAWQFIRPRLEGKVIIELGGMTWNRHAFCQGWLITGVTGSGKTLSGIHGILHQLFKRGHRFGMLCIDDKAVLHETLVGMARHFGREQDTILLQVNSDKTNPESKPAHRFNLIGDRSIPAATYARCVVDTAVAMGNRREQSFFRRAAQILIEQGITALVETGELVNLENVHGLLTDPKELQVTTGQLRANPATKDLARQFQDLMDQPPEQRAGIISTVANYLHYFTSPEIAEVFCRDSTFSLKDLDQGRLICLALPQRLQTERRYLGTFLKQLFHLHLLHRFDQPREDREKLNLLVLLADEAQHFVNASEDGLSDHSLVDVIRESGAAFIAATQSTTSLIPPLGAEQAKVFTLNLRNRLIFTAADEDDARASAEFLGKKKVVKRSWTTTNGQRSQTLSEGEDYRVKPHELRRLRKHQCYVVHSDKGHHKRTLPPLEPDGSVSKWFRQFWLRF